MNHSNETPKHEWRKTMTAVGFVGWSAAMFLLGSMSPGVGYLQSPTATPLVRLDRDRLAGGNLGEFAPYEPESGNLIARGYDYYYSEDENFGIGVWESQPGEMTYTDLEYDELMYVLDGALVMTDEEGTTETFGPGEGLVLPTGWTGTLAVPEGGVRKIWVSYMAGEK